MKNNPMARTNEPTTTVPEVDSIDRYLVLHPVPKEAQALVLAQAGHAFDRDSKGELDRLALEREGLEEDLDETGRRIQSLSHEQEETEEFIPVPGAGEVKPWSLEDLTQLAGSMSTMLALLAMSASAVYANLMASGVPIFLEQPMLAWVLAALAPAASFTLHYGIWTIEHRRARQRFERCLFTLAGVLVLAWSVLFAATYTGTTGQLDLSSFGEPSRTASLLVWTQLAAEIATASCLFTVIERLCAKHRADALQANPDYAEITLALKQALQRRETLRTRRAENAMRQRELQAAREAAINLALARFLAHRARFDAFQSN